MDGLVLRRLLLSLLAAASSAAPPSSAAVQSSAPPWQFHGVVFGGGEWSSAAAPLGSPQADASLRAAVTAGASAIRLIPTWYTDGENSTAIYRNQNGSAAGPFATETDAHVAHTIDYARSLGASVVLGPLVDPNYALPWVLRDGYPGAECLLWRSGKAPGAQQKPPNCTASGDLPRQGRGPIGRYFSDAQWRQWFASYSAMMLGYARLAEKHHASVLIVAAELWAAMGHPPNEPRWRKLVAEIRAVFHGKLAIAANANDVVAWADAVDILGFDMYNGPSQYGGLPPAAPEPPSVGELASAWSGYISFLKNISATFGKPIMATELGFQSRPRSFLAPAGAIRFNPVDCSVYLKCYNMEDQRLAYAAFYQAFSEATEGQDSDAPWFAGALWWMWRSDPTSGGVNDLTFTPQGKPAATVMQDFARRQGTLLALPEAAAAGAAASAAAAAVAAEEEAAAAEERESTPERSDSEPLRGGGGGGGPPWPQKENGIVVGSGEWTSFEDPMNSSHLDSAAAAQSLANAKAHGINSAEFIPTWFFPGAKHAF